MNRASDQNESAIEKGSSNSTADMAVEGRPQPDDHLTESPFIRKAEPLAEDETPDQLADKVKEAEDRQEALLDEAIEESFPGSDPISPSHVD